MKQIIVKVDPFIRKQSCFIFDGTHLIPANEFYIEDLAAGVRVMCKENSIQNVTLCGPAALLEKTKEDIYTLFENETINVRILEK